MNTNTVRIIPDRKGTPCAELRKAHFLRAFGREVETMRIVSFGTCNFHCPYCKRDGQYIDDAGNIISSRDFPEAEVYTALEDAVAKGQRIRLSGGDPCMHMRESLKIAEWAKEKGQKISIAHNGSSPRFVEAIAPYLAYAAIDLKSPYPDDFNLRAGLVNGQGARMLARSIEVQDFLSRSGVPVDVRTPVFAETTIDDMLRVAELVVAGGDPGHEFLTFRCYSRIAGLDWAVPSAERVGEMVQEVSRQFPGLPVGMRARWKGGFTIWKAGTELA